MAGVQVQQMSQGADGLQAPQPIPGDLGAKRGAEPLAEQKLRSRKRRKKEGEGDFLSQGEEAKDAGETEMRAASSS